MTSITVGAAQIASYGYDNLGRRRNGGAGAGTTYGYDGADRINSLAQSLSGTGAVTYSPAYDPSGGLVSRQVTNGTYSWHPGSANTAYSANSLKSIH